jgi:uncharacterized beta-barrel protein YwiB (DUF1934 family)
MADRNKVNIGIRSRTDGQELDQHAEGELFRKGEQIYVRYQEEQTAMGRTTTTVKLDGMKLKVIRHGDVTSDQTFISGEWQMGFYETPQGLLELKTYTHQLETQLTEGFGVISWSYDLYVSGELSGIYSLDLTIQEAGKQ